MKTIFNKITNSVIALSVLAILFAVVLIVYPGFSLLALGCVVAVYLIAHGITLIYIGYKARKLYIPYDGAMQGVLYVLLGILLAANPESLAIYIGISVGLWIIVSSINNIKIDVSLKGTGAPWVLMTVLNIIDIIIGVAVLLTPVLSSVSLTVALGCVIIVHSVIHIINMISVKQNVKNLEKAIMEKIR